MVNITEDRDVSLQPNELFNKRWQLYQKVLFNNYMNHREFYGVLHDFLTQYWQKPFSLLELGCGDASFTVQALLNTNIAAYTGIDLSQDALAIAQANMAVTPYSKNFIQGDICAVVSQLESSQENSFDIVLTSFAFHHLNLEQKENVMAQLSHLLSSDGMFLVIDIVRSPEESRETYIERYLENVRQNWSQLTSQDVNMVAEHICLEDLPETNDTLNSLARKHGFTSGRCLYQDPQNTSQLLCFDKI